MRPIVAAVVGIALLGQSGMGWAASEQGSTIEQIGYGTGSVVGSAVYFPFKAAFCILGGLGSGVTLVAAGKEKATKVASASCRGTWMITPEVVKGKEQIRFVGDVPATDKPKTTP